MAKHILIPSRETLHGTFSKSYKPVLEIQSGDTVSITTLEAGWATESFAAPDERVVICPRDQYRDAGHALCGPIAIRGAEPGMTLQVTINDIRTATWGWSSAGGFSSEVNDRLGVAEGAEYFLQWQLDPVNKVGESNRGHKATLKPFMGVMGMPPDEEGVHSTAPPRYCGGNIDCKELVAGSILYLPVSVESALFSVGDGHAAQGDGEVAGPALECAMDSVDLTLTLIEQRSLRYPYAKTPSGWITFGFHESLNEATFIALEGMQDLICEMSGMGRKEALAFASIHVDLRITQIVNGVKGVHAVLPLNLL